MDGKIEKMNKEMEELGRVIEVNVDLINDALANNEDETIYVSRANKALDDLSGLLVDKRLYSLLHTDGISNDPIKLMETYALDPLCTVNKLIVHRATKTADAFAELGTKEIRVPISRLSAAAKKEGLQLGAGDWKSSAQKAQCLLTARLAYRLAPTDEKGLAEQHQVLRDFGMSRKAFGLPMGNIPVSEEECEAIIELAFREFVGDISPIRGTAAAILESMTRRGRVKTIRVISTNQFIDLLVDGINATLTKSGFRLVYRTSKIGSTVECCLLPPPSKKEEKKDN